jgi:hypothetical protein
LYFKQKSSIKFVMTGERITTDPKDQRFSWQALNPREDRAEPHTLYVDREGTFSKLRSRPGEPGALLGCKYVDSDHLQRAQGLPMDFYAASGESADEVGNNDSPRFFEEALRRAYDTSELTLRHLIVGCNVGNGYPYLRFGFTMPGQEEAAVAKENEEIDAIRVAETAELWIKKFVRKLVTGSEHSVEPHDRCTD